MTPARAVVTATPLALALALLAPARGEADRRSVPVPREGAVPAGLRSFVTAREAPVHAAPTRAAPVLGHAAAGAGFPLRAAGPRRGTGCGRLWIAVAEGRWICGDDGALSPEALAPAAWAPPRTSVALPWGYVFTAADSTPAYATLGDALTGDASRAETWEANWGFAVQAERLVGTERVLETLGGRFVRRRDVYRAEPSDFAGATVRELRASESVVPFGWVVSTGARTWRTPEDAARHPAGEGTLARLTPLHVYGTRRLRGVDWAWVEGGLWVRADRLRVFAPAAPPAAVDVAAGERWIDVDLAQQMLVAWEGTVPVYATVVSTGAPGHETPAGEFRIWGKYGARTMDNTENTALRGHFRLGDVPYVQFFDGDRGLHGVYWHDEFGHPRSHGCVNLAPRDAEYLFRFTAPALPDGWQSTTADVAPGGRGTLVRVRGTTPVEPRVESP